MTPHTVKKSRIVTQPQVQEPRLPIVEKYELIKTKNKELKQKNKTLVNDLNHVKKRLLQVSREKSVLLDKLLSLQQSQSAAIITKKDVEIEKEGQQDEDIDIEDMSILSPTTPTPSVTEETTLPKREPPDETTTLYVSRPKRQKRDPVESKLRRVLPLEKEDNGNYKLPARVGIITVHSLGKIVPIPTYHNDRYIWPPGFKISRTYLSMVNPSTNTTYTCTIEENGEQGPKFRVIAEDCPENSITANSATGVWTAIVKSANEIRNREHSNSASGPDYYGFTHATIAKMIQDLPNADQCENYVWQKFDVMHQRTAAGVAAAAQKKIANLEIMGSANKRPTKADIDHQHHAQQQQLLNQQSYNSGGASGMMDNHEQHYLAGQLKRQQTYYKKSSLHQIMNTSDELESQQQQESKLSSPSITSNTNSFNYV